MRKREKKQKNTFVIMVNLFLEGGDTFMRNIFHLPDLLQKMKEFHDYSRKNWNEKLTEARDKLKRESRDISVFATIDNFFLEITKKTIEKIKKVKIQANIKSLRSYLTELKEKFGRIKIPAFPPIRRAGAGMTKRATESVDESAEMKTPLPVSEPHPDKPQIGKISKLMIINIEVKTETIEKIKTFLEKMAQTKVVVLISVVLSTSAIGYFYITDKIVAYGDAESHLNIAKRVVSSLTPGLGQIGGVWLPMPHILMIPFIENDFMWRSGLAGSIVSGGAFILASFFIFRFVLLLTQNKLASFFAFLVFALNPNMLYMQSTPMTEPLLITFFLMSSFYFVKFIKNQEDLFALILAAIFGFFASLTRYEGWFLVLFEALILIAYHVQHGALKKLEGKLVLFCTPAFFGILLWMLWGFLILGDPLYFMNSPFSAKSQQNNWLVRGELPAYHNLPLSILYYFVTAMSNVGVFIFFMSLVALFVFLKKRFTGHMGLRDRFFIAFLLLAPAIFYVVTLYVGQSVIFIPHLTPVGFEWRLFNVRYGLMMVPVAAILLGWLYSRGKINAKLLIIMFFMLQFGLYAVGYSKVITLEDGSVGLSHAKRPDAEQWMAKHYDSGLVLLDDYARTLSIIRSGIPMQNVIYIGNQYYWIDSLRNPDKWAQWIIMQRNDAVWKAIYDNPVIRGRLFAHFNKEYTSKEILIFKKTR